MGAMPIAVKLPFFELFLQLRVIQAHSGIEFSHIGFLGTFDFTIQMGATRFDRSEFYAILHQLFLYLDAKKLATSIRLNPLDGKWKFVNNTLKKQQSVSSSASVMDT